MLLSAPQHRAFIAHHFAGIGQLDIVDLLSARAHDRVVVVDPLDWADAHLVGPAQRSRGTAIQLENGEAIVSYFRSRLLPFDRNGTTSVLNVQFTDQYSLVPTEPICRFSAWLNRRSLPHFVERCFRIGQWCIWIFLNRRERLETVRNFASALRGDAREDGVLDPNITSMPALEKEPEGLYVPLHFLSGGFFGVLHTLRGGTCREADLHRIPHIDLLTGDLSLVTFGADAMTQILEILVREWAFGFGARKVRASGLIELAACCGGISIEQLTGEAAPHSQAIALGRLLHRLNNKQIGDHTVHARHSGNSSVFWVT